MVPLARPCKKKQRQQQQQQQHHHHHLRYARRNSGSSGITTAAAATASAVTATMVTQYLLLGITIIIIIITIVMIMISQHHNHKNNNEDEDDENDGEHSYCSNKTSQAGKEDEQSSCNHVGVKALHNGTVPILRVKPHAQTASRDREATKFRSAGRQQTIANFVKARSSATYTRKFDARYSRRVTSNEQETQPPHEVLLTLPGLASKSDVTKPNDEQQLHPNAQTVNTNIGGIPRTTTSRLKLQRAPSSSCSSCRRGGAVIGGDVSGLKAFWAPQP